MPSAINVDPSPPAVAIIANSHTPYRHALHRRIVRELPEIYLHSLFTHETSNSPWKFTAGDDIHAVLFGRGSSSEDQDKASRAHVEFAKGKQIIRWMKDNKVRAVVVMGYNDAGRLRIIRWCRRNNIPAFVFGDSNIVGDRATGLKRFVKNRLVGWVVKSVTGVLPCGTMGREYFKRYGATDDRIFYFPYEPDYSLIEHLPQFDVTAAARKFDFAANRRRIIYSGRLLSFKRVDLLVDSFVSIANDFPDVDLVIAGDGVERAMLENRVPTELKSRVQWLGFIDNQQLLCAIYKNCDVLVLPSDYEPWAVVINEAACAGLAIIASQAVGAAVEIVRDKINGRRFETSSLSDLTRSLVQVLNPQTLQQMKQASPQVLADWRQRGDPVQGLKKALQFAGVI